MKIRRWLFSLALLSAMMPWSGVWAVNEIIGVSYEKESYIFRNVSVLVNAPLRFASVYIRYKDYWDNCNSTMETMKFVPVSQVTNTMTKEIAAQYPYSAVSLSASAKSESEIKYTNYGMYVYDSTSLNKEFNFRIFIQKNDLSYQDSGWYPTDYGNGCSPYTAMDYQRYVTRVTYPTTTKPRSSILLYVEGRNLAEYKNGTLADTAVAAIDHCTSMKLSNKPQHTYRLIFSCTMAPDDDIRGTRLSVTVKDKAGGNKIYLKENAIYVKN